ncbi:MAG: RluA family pseudouridine synthase [Sulfurovaceae bacterium]|nr:RluA family pseudouridine synthase [Sulfurovaceae bacterium]
MAEKFKVKQEDKLLNFLFNTLSGWSKKKVKERLKSATVAVNGEVTTKHDFPLTAEDIVEVGVIQKRKSSVDTIRRVEILYQDSDIIAINKPHGLLSVGTTQENKQHALALLRNQLSRGKRDLKIFPVHRLDRDTSGVLLFATSKEIREKIMDKWAEAEKIYLAIVEGSPKEPKGTINQPLRLDEKEYKMHVGEHKFAKEAITHYELKKTEPQRSLLEVKLETGRQHQIRAHLSWLGHAVIGDERYGKKGEKLGLHARYLKIYHPSKSKFLSFEVDAPTEFYRLLR